MYRSLTLYGNKYSRFASATLLAIKEYNLNRKKFTFEPDQFIMLTDLIKEVNHRVNNYCDHKGCCYTTEHLIHANTPMGIELEFSNKGHTAGKLFESHKNDALHNFSKYHYYHLTKFMWRFGAYVDAEMPFKQFIRRGGFLEYTFTRPDVAFKPSEPLTSSPAQAARLIEEAIKFTPVKPHSLHVTFQIDKSSKKLPKPTLDDVKFMYLCTGNFISGTESRILEKNMKEWAAVRERRNDEGWVLTVEFTHMRASRDFVRRKSYEPSILLLLAFKNIFSFYDIDIYSESLIKWAKNPSPPEKDPEAFFKKVRQGVDKEISLPEWYKDEQIDRMKKLYNYNINLISDGVSFG